MSAPKEKGPGLVTQSNSPSSSQGDFTTTIKVFGELAENSIFVAWVPGPVDPKTGKFPKKPIGDNGFPLPNWPAPANWMTLPEAFARAEKWKSKGAGIGVAFNGEPVAGSAMGEPLYLVALDLDDVILPRRDERGNVTGTKMSMYARDAIEQMGSYAEVSPSGKGVRILAYSKTPMMSGKATKIDIDGVMVGREIFASSGFVTLTGLAINSMPIKVKTAKLGLVAKWWGLDQKTRTRGEPPADDPKANMSEDEKQRLIAKLEDAVPYLDTESYEDFVSVMKAFACLAPGIGEDVAIRLAENAAKNASETAQAGNDKDGNNPEAMVLRGGNAGVDAGAGRLMKRARIQALKVVAAEIGKPIISSQVGDAYKFLDRHYPTLANALAFVAAEALS